MTQLKRRIPAARMKARRPKTEPTRRMAVASRVVAHVAKPRPVATDTSQSRAAVRRVITVAWLSILLGLLMQGVLLMAKVSVGPWPVYSKIFLDLVQGVTWSFFVCAGVGLGTTVAKSKAYLGGIIGMVAGPLAMGIAKGAQKLVGSILGVADAPVVVSLAELGVVRAFEYGILGWALASMVARDETRAHRFLGMGAAVGLVFGTGATWLTLELARTKNITLTDAQLLTTVLNEVLFPIGCSLVVFTALTVGRHLKLIAAVSPKKAQAASTAST